MEINGNIYGIHPNNQSKNNLDGITSEHMKDSLAFQGNMPASGAGEMGKANLQRVLVELRVPKTIGILGATQVIARMHVYGFQLDTSYEPIAIPTKAGQAQSLEAGQQQIVVVRGVIEESKIPQLEARPNVMKVYKDVPLTPFEVISLEKKTTPRDRQE